ncbi:dimethyladenosine transferase [Cyclospora cayetanensis]|uniref:rRNA adenine N(6)-methyltransferase n=1 Tax=Cyclospora cayetanensis TaxID=88456 RepID=A0A1D3D7J4_9EIME|nr:dimethyladenosine transferase [Cyclospora cayetanensis]
MPWLQVLHEDVLQVNWPYLASRMQPLRVVGNLPFYLTSQLLFCLLDCRHCIDVAVVTLQREVAERLVARQGDSQYCRLSVAFALLARPSLLFYIPSKAFYPQPKVEAAVVRVDFRRESDAELLAGVDAKDLKRVLFAAFGQRRKMLRQSLKSILPPGVSVPEEFGALRPQALAPSQFVELTAALFGRNGADDLAGREAKANSADSTETVESLLTDPPPIPRIPAKVPAQSCWLAAALSSLGESESRHLRKMLNMASEDLRGDGSPLMRAHGVHETLCSPLERIKRSLRGPLERPDPDVRGIGGPSVGGREGVAEFTSWPHFPLQRVLLHARRLPAAGVKLQQMRQRLRALWGPPRALLFGPTQGGPLCDHPPPTIPVPGSPVRGPPHLCFLHPSKRAFACFEPSSGCRAAGSHRCNERGAEQEPPDSLPQKPWPKEPPFPQGPPNARQLMAGILARGGAFTPRSRPSGLGRPPSGSRELQAQRVASVLQFAQQHIEAFDAVHCGTALLLLGRLARQLGQDSLGGAAAVSAVVARGLAAWQQQQSRSLLLPSSLCSPLLRCLYTHAAFLSLRSKLLDAFGSLAAPPNAAPTGASDSAPQLISNTLWALGALRTCDVPLILAALAALQRILQLPGGSVRRQREHLQHAHSLLPVDICNIFWGLATAADCSNAFLVTCRSPTEQRPQQQCRHKTQTFLAAERQRLQGALVEAFAAVGPLALQQLEAFEPRGLATLSWAVARAGVYVHPRAALEETQTFASLLRIQRANLHAVLQQQQTLELQREDGEPSAFYPGAPPKGVKEGPPGDSTFAAATSGLASEGQRDGLFRTATSSEPAAVFMQFYDSAVGPLLQRGALRKLSIQQIANLLWGFAAVGHFSPPLCFAAAEELLKRVTEARGGGLLGAPTGAPKSGRLRDEALLSGVSSEGVSADGSAPHCGSRALERALQTSEVSPVSCRDVAAVMLAASQHRVFSRALFVSLPELLLTGGGRSSTSSEPYRRDRFLQEASLRDLASLCISMQRAVEFAAPGALAALRLATLDCPHERRCLRELTKRAQKEILAYVKLQVLCGVLFPANLGATIQLTPRLFEILTDEALRLAESYNSKLGKHMHRPSPLTEAGSALSPRWGPSGGLKKEMPRILLETADYLVVYKPPYWLVNPSQTNSGAPKDTDGGASPLETPAWASFEGPSQGALSTQQQTTTPGTDSSEVLPAAETQTVPLSSFALLHSGRPEPLHLYLRMRLLEGASPLLPRAPSSSRQMDPSVEKIAEARCQKGHGNVSKRKATRPPRVSPSDEAFARILSDSSVASGCTHRIDCETSGPILIAKNERAFHKARMTFEAHKLKGFWGVSAPIKTLKGGPPHNAIFSYCDVQGKPSTTLVRPLLYLQREGRTHQIRVHLSALGHPLVMDYKYQAGRRAAAVPAAKVEARGPHKKALCAACEGRPSRLLACADLAKKQKVLRLRMILDALKCRCFVGSAADSAAYLSDRLWCPRLFLHCFYLGVSAPCRHADGEAHGGPPLEGLEVHSPLPSDLVAALGHLQAVGSRPCI